MLLNLSAHLFGHGIKPSMDSPPDLACIGEKEADDYGTLQMYHHFARKAEDGSIKDSQLHITKLHLTTTPRRSKGNAQSILNLGTRWS
jgi:hypothetical protein